CADSHGYVTSSLDARRDIGSLWCLPLVRFRTPTCVVNGNTFMTHDALNRCTKGRTIERGLPLAALFLSTISALSAIYSKPAPSSVSTPRSQPIISRAPP